MADPRRIILADPLAVPGRTRFAVAGQGAPGGIGDIKMYEWDGQAENMNMVGIQVDTGGVKALAWSPHPAQRHLLALGLATGRTQLTSVSPRSLSLPFRGAAAPAAVLPVKHTRAVNSLAFSPRDPNILAAAYERHRSDYSLLIWDVSDAVTALPRDPDGEASWDRPASRLEVTNPLARGEPQRRTSSTGAEHLRHIQQYCASEAVHSVAWLPSSSVMGGTELLASANNKVIRLYDLRAPSVSTPGPSPHQGAAAQWTTRAVHMLSPDPDHAYRVASVETSPGGGAVRFWDIRRPGAEVAAIETESAVVDIEWAKGAGGVLAVGTREGGIAVWDIVAGPQRGGVDEWTAIGGMRHVIKPRLNLQSFAFAPPTSPARRDLVFVVKDGTIGVGPVGKAPALASSASGELAVSSSSLTVIDPEVPSRTRAASRAISRSASRVPSPTRAGRRSVTVHDDWRTNRFQLAPERISALLAEEAERQSRSGNASPMPGSRRSLPILPDDDDDELSDDFQYGEEASNADGFRRILRHDAAYIMRRRAEQGYGLDNLLLNAAIASRFPGSQRIAGVWELVDHLVRASTPEVSQHGTYDLTYQGLWSIWTGLLGSEGRLDAPAPPASASAAWTNLRQHGVSATSRDGPSSGSSTPRRSTVDAHNSEYNLAVANINALRSDLHTVAAPGSHKLPHTERAPQRRMMLALCGENNTYDTMEEVNRLVADDQRTKAACWAFFAGEEGPAITILMRSDDERHRLMGTTIAGFMSQSRAERGSLFWQEHWSGLVTKVDDPYVRAVLARLAGENWDGILFDESLPLLDRAAMAVCNLGDKDLTHFLRDRVKRCLHLGSLQGLILTGFTPSGVLLLQRFLDRTGDIQTVALLSAYFPRRHLSPTEVRQLDTWHASYASLLDSWLQWVARCALDVAILEQRRQLADPASPDTVQTVVLCPVCKSQLSKQTEEMLTRKNALRGVMNAPTVRTTSCMYCQNALPRCCVCLLHVRPANDDVVDTMDSAYVSCQTCRHGGHAVHILGWFEGGLDGEPAHDVCPVAGCDCRCANL